MSAAAFPSISVEVAFTNNPYDSSPTWVDITKYVQSFTTTMGRQHELQQVNPSTAKIVLWNGAMSHGDTTGGRFSPWNTGSAYYNSGNGLVPTKPVKITATYSSTTYNIFYGYVDNWTPGYGETSSIVTLNCSDILKLLNLDTLDTNQYDVYPLANAAHYWPLDDPVNSVEAIDAITSTAATASYSCAFGQPGPFLTQTDTALLTSNGYLNNPTSWSSTTFTTDGWILCDPTEIQPTVYNTVSDNTGAFSLGCTPPIGGSPVGYAYVDAYGTFVQGVNNVYDGQWHYYAATGDGTNLKLYVDGVLAGSTPASGTVTLPTSGDGFIAFNETLGGVARFAQVAIYDYALTAAEILSQYQLGASTFVVQDSGSRISEVLDLVGVPAGLNNVGTGTITCLGATSNLATTTAMSYINTVVNTERGLLYQDGAGVIQFRNRQYVYTNSTSTTSNATFGYTTGQLHYYSQAFVPASDDIDTWNNVNVQATGGLVQNASDSTSITAHGRRTLTGYTNLLFTNDIDSLDLADGLLYQYKEPSIRVRSIKVDNLIGAGAALPQMLGRQLLDRVTINWRPLDGSSVDFSQPSLIEQISHSVDAATRTWTTTFAVTPIGTESFFILGTSQLGTGILGF